MNNKKLTKTICVALSFVLAFSLGMAASLGTSREETFADEKNAIDFAVGDISGKLSEKNAPLLLGNDIMYVVANANGAPSKVLSYNEGDFENHALDTYKQPVDVKLTYTLDGQEIDAKELAGKSGAVTIRFDYTNNEKKGDYFVPYIVLSGVILDDEIFSNVQIEHGKAVDDGSRTIAGGIALPGMKNNIDPNGEIEDIQKIPEYIEISADAKNFALDMTLSVAVPFNTTDVELSSLTGISDLGNDIKALVDATEKLCQGGESLAGGTKDLANGANTLSGGANDLNNGLGTLAKNSESLRGGALAVFNSLLKTVKTQLEAAGLAVPELTVENYAAVLNKIIEDLDETKVYNAILAQVTAAVAQAVIAMAQLPGITTYEEYLAAKEAKLIPEQTVIQIDAAIEGGVAQQMSSPEVLAKLAAASEGAKKVIEAKAQLDSYNAFYQGLITYTAGVDSAALGSGQIASGAFSLKDGAGKLNDGANELAGGLAQFNDEAIGKITSLFGENITDAIKRISDTVEIGKSASPTKYVIRTASI